MRGDCNDAFAPPGEHMVEAPDDLDDTRFRGYCNYIMTVTDKLAQEKRTPVTRSRVKWNSPVLTFAYPAIHYVPDNLYNSLKQGNVDPGDTLLYCDQNPEGCRRACCYGGTPVLKNLYLSSKGGVDSEHPGERWAHYGGEWSGAMLIRLASLFDAVMNNRLRMYKTAYDRTPNISQNTHFSYINNDNYLGYLKNWVTGGASTVQDTPSGTLYVHDSNPYAFNLHIKKGRVGDTHTSIYADYVCPGPQGATCDYDEECLSGKCTAYPKNKCGCVRNSDCKDSNVCNISTNTCKNKVHERCEANEDCITGVCLSAVKKCGCA
jgi:hypothetical protein